jgi:hypothetical protein
MSTKRRLAPHENLSCYTYLNHVRAGGGRSPSGKLFTCDDPASVRWLSGFTLVASLELIEPAMIAEIWRARRVWHVSSHLAIKILFMCDEWRCPGHRGRDMTVPVAYDRRCIDPWLRARPGRTAFSKAEDVSAPETFNPVSLGSIPAPCVRGEITSAGEPRGRPPPSGTPPPAGRAGSGHEPFASAVPRSRPTKPSAPLPPSRDGRRRRTRPPCRPPDLQRPAHQPWTRVSK